MNTQTLISGISDIVYVLRPGAVNFGADFNNLDPQWVSGFVSGEGCFTVGIKKESKAILGETSWLRFMLTQHNRDTDLIKSFVNFFKCGKINEASLKRGDAVYFTVQKRALRADLINIIIPFFDKYPIRGVKVKDFQDFQKVAELMSYKKHLTRDGLDQILKIKNVMNTNRK